MEMNSIERYRILKRAAAMTYGKPVHEKLELGERGDNAEWLARASNSDKQMNEEK